MMLQSAFAYHFLLGDGFPQGENSELPMASWLWAITLGPLVLATAIRWLIIPKLKEFQPQLVAMIVGLAFSEGAIFMELFLIGSEYPQYQIAILMVSVFSLIQFAPIYAIPFGDVKRNT